MPSADFLVLAVLLVFSRTLSQGFLKYDDNVFVYDEPHVSGGLSWSGIAWAFTNGPLGEWYPLSMLSHMLDCQLYGLNPAGHHLTNLLLHAASAVTLFLVLWRMTGELWPSALVAALFALHPLHVESVAWVAERRDVLSGLFFMLTLGAYGEYVRHPRSLGRYLAVVGLFALGLMAKPMLVTLPPLLLLLDFWPLRRFGRTQPDAAAPNCAAGAVSLARRRGQAAAFGIGHRRGRRDDAAPTAPLRRSLDIARAIGQCGRFVRRLSGATLRPGGTLDFLFPSRGGPAGMAGRRRSGVAAGDHGGRGDWPPIVSLLLRRLVLVRRNAGSGARADLCGCACPRRPLHVPFANRALHCAGLGGDAAGCIVAGSALGVWRRLGVDVSGPDGLHLAADRLLAG